MVCPDPKMTYWSRGQMLEEVLQDKVPVGVPHIGEATGTNGAPVMTRFDCYVFSNRHVDEIYLPLINRLNYYILVSLSHESVDALLMRGDWNRASYCEFSRGYLSGCSPSFDNKSCIMIYHPLNVFHWFLFAVTPLKVSDQLKKVSAWNTWEGRLSWLMVLRTFRWDQDLSYISKPKRLRNGSIFVTYIDMPTKCMIWTPTHVECQ